MIGLIFEHAVGIVVTLAAFVAGGLLMPQSVHDKFSGVAPELRTAVNARVAAVQQEMDDAAAKALANAVKAVQPPVPVPPPNPVQAVAPAPPPPAHT